MRVATLRIGNLAVQSEMARDADLPHSTARRYLNLLETSFQVVRIEPFAANRTKRVVKTPKLFWSDTGLGLHVARGLRFAMDERLPLVYLHGLVKGRYLATWPVYIVADDPESLSFFVAVDDADHISLSAYGEWAVGEDAGARRRYVTTVARRRLHQRAFRERVLLAYRHQCAACHLRHDELLDAAHIIPDADPEGEPIISNGLALCRLHHAAFDRFFIGLRPDYVIQVRPDLLEEEDGPTLRHAIQDLHGQAIRVPHREGHRPNVALLTRRYDRFVELAGV